MNKSIKTLQGSWRKSEIVAAAAKCFMEKGYSATSVDDVAASIGCTKGRIYHHYGSKTDLFFDVHRQGMEYLFDAVMPVMRNDSTALSVLEHMLLAHAGAMLEYHTYESVVAQGVHLHRFGNLDETQRAVLDELIFSRDAFEGLFKKVLLKARKEGAIGDIDPSVAVKMMLGALQWSIFWYRPEQGDSQRKRQALTRKMVTPLMLGIAARSV